MEEQGMRVIAAFLVSLVVVYITAKIVGEENKARWFKKRQQTSFLNRRGFLGESLNFGYPRTWQGAAVFAAMFGIIGVVSYIIIFVMGT